MARLYFDFTRTATVTEDGVIAIDVTDPADDNEVRDALREQKFKMFQTLDRVYDNESWDYSEWNEGEEPVEGFDIEEVD